MNKSLSIIVPAYDRPDLLRETLQSILQLRVPADVTAEVLVVLSMRMQDTVAVVTAAQAQATLPLRLVPERQPGLSNARNQGMEEASGDHLAYFDDDILVSKDWIQGYFEAVERQAADCVVGPVSPRYCAEIPAYISREVLDSILSVYSRKGGELKLLNAEVAHEIPGCNFGVRRQVAREVGGFSPRFGRAGSVIVGGDDFEFGQRLVAAGKRVAYQPLCAIDHAITTEKFSKSWLRRRWHGAGVYHRRSAPDPVFMQSRWGRARSWLSVVRTFTGSALLGLAGRSSESFEKELRAREALGFLRGR